MKRKKQTSPLPCFIFDHEMTSLANEAMLFLAQPLQHVNQQQPKVALFQKTMKQLQAKLASMQRSDSQVYWTTFDHNEKAILCQAIQLSIVHRAALPPNPQREKQIQQCQQIAALLTPESQNRRFQRSGRRRT